MVPRLSPKRTAPSLRSPTTPPVEVEAAKCVRRADPRASQSPAGRGPFCPRSIPDACMTASRAVAARAAPPIARSHCGRRLVIVPAPVHDPARSARAVNAATGGWLALRRDTRTPTSPPILQESEFQGRTDPQQKRDADGDIFGSGNQQVGPNVYPASRPNILLRNGRRPGTRARCLQPELPMVEITFAGRPFAISNHGAQASELRVNKGQAVRVVTPRS